MKHLKIFEAFGTDEYYVPISQDEYYDDEDFDFIGNQMVNRIRMKVLSYIKDSTLLNQDKGVEIWDMEWNKGESSIEFEQSHSGLTISLYEKIDRLATKPVGSSWKREKITAFEKVQYWKIEVKPDEWFVVRINDVDDESYYKCDQWDGLMRLFKDVLEPQIESMS